MEKGDARNRVCVCVGSEWGWRRMVGKTGGRVPGRRSPNHSLQGQPARHCSCRFSVIRAAVTFILPEVKFNLSVYFRLKSTVQIAVASYDKDAAIPLLPSQSASKAEILEALESLDFPGGGEPTTTTTTPSDLTTVTTSIFNQTEGADGEKVNQVLVLVTNGSLEEFGAIEATVESLNNGGVKIIIIDVGDATSGKELQYIAGNPADFSLQLHVGLDDSGALTSARHKVIKLVCEGLLEEVNGLQQELNQLANDTIPFWNAM